MPRTPAANGVLAKSRPPPHRVGKAGKPNGSLPGVSPRRCKTPPEPGQAAGTPAASAPPRGHAQGRQGEAAELLGIRRLVLAPAGVSTQRLVRAIPVPGWCFCWWGVAIRGDASKPPAILRAGSPANSRQVQAPPFSSSLERGQLHQLAKLGQAQGIAHRWQAIRQLPDGSAASEGRWGWISTGLAALWWFAPQGPSPSLWGSPWRRPRTMARKRSLSGSPLWPRQRWTKGTGRQRGGAPGKNFFFSKGSQRSLFSAPERPEAVRPTFAFPAAIHLPSPSIHGSNGCRCAQLQIGDAGELLELLRARPARQPGFHAVVWLVLAARPQLQHRAIFKKRRQCPPSHRASGCHCRRHRWRGHHPWLISRPLGDSAQIRSSWSPVTAMSGSPH